MSFGYISFCLLLLADYGHMADNGYYSDCIYGDCPPSEYGFGKPDFDETGFGRPDGM